MAAALERVAPGGLIMSFGNSSGEPAPYDFAAIMAAGAPEARIEHYASFRHAAQAGAGLEVLLALLAAGRLAADVGFEAPWSELGAALDALRDRQVAGKAVLRVE
jgi:NADPH:quinone reductase-like Zn-dependent oxidoreductase